MKTALYKTIDQKFIKEWQLLWEKSSYANYTNSPQWFLSAVDAFKFKNYAIIAIYEEEKLIATGAFVKEKKYGLSVYTIAPADFVCGEPFLLDWENKLLIKTFVANLLALGIVNFTNLPEKIVLALQKETKQLNVTKQTINLFFSIKKDDKEKVLIPKRSRLTNRIRGLEEQFVMESFDGTNSKGLELVFSIDKESSKEKKGYSAFANKNIRSFYKNLSQKLEKKFLVAVMFYNEKPIAYYIGFIVKGVFYWSQNAYISEYGQYSPGKVLLVKLIDFLGTKNVTEIDFGSGDYPMKRLLTDEYRDMYQMTISKNAFVRLYMQYINKIENNLYEKLYNNKMLYATYRKGKKLIK